TQSASQHFPSLARVLRRISSLLNRDGARKVCPVTAIVTGAAGFLGRALVSALLDAGEKVVGIDRRPYPGPAPAGLEMITADLLGDDPRVRAALETADAVYHLAGRPGVRERGPHVAAARRRDNVLAAAR